jgi:3-hydroxymyristoyl/3-hydroxydecanoyl-(acyl carrier protein) dehydratase
MRFLFVEKILELSPGKHTLGLMHVSEAPCYLAQDSHGKDYLIPSLIGEALGQLAAWNVMHCHDFKFRPVAGLVSKAQFHRRVRVGETLRLESYIEKLDDQAVQYHAVAKVGDEIVFNVDDAIGPLLATGMLIDPDVARQQFAEIYQERIAPKTIAPPHKNTAAFFRFDKFIDTDPGVRLIAEKYICGSAPFFADHFPRKPVLPMTILLECMLQLAAEYLKQAQLAYLIKGLSKVKISDFIQPGDTLIGEVLMKPNGTLFCQCKIDEKRICVATVILE